MNKRDIVTRALREIGVVGYQRTPNGQMYQAGEEKLEQLFADLNGPWGGVTLTFGIDDPVPAAYQNPLIWLLSARLAGMFSRPAPVGETTALIRLRTVANPMVPSMDLDGDGTTTEDEICAFDRGAYF